MAKRKLQRIDAIHKTEKTRIDWWDHFMSIGYDIAMLDCYQGFLARKIAFAKRRPSNFHREFLEKVRAYETDRSKFLSENYTQEELDKITAIRKQRNVRHRR